MGAALNLAPGAGSAVGEAAATQTTRLVLLQGGLSETGGAALAGEAGVGALAGEAGAGALGAGAVAGEAGVAAVGTEAVVGAGAAGGAALSAGAIVATAGIALVVIAAVGLGYYLYKRSHQVPSKPKAANPCPPLGDPTVSPKPNITPKPVPIDKRIPNADRAREVARRKEEANRQRCQELWESIEKRTNRRRKKPGAGQQGFKYRYWDMICSGNDPNTPEGGKIWDDHEQAFENDRAGLQRDIDEFEQKCDGDLPQGAQEYVKKPFPKKSEWRGNTPECEQYRRERQERYDKYKNDPTADND